MIRDVYTYVKKYPLLICILVLGWSVSLSFIFPITKQLGHDTYWHMALISVAFNSFPPEVPIFAGQSLLGYNYLLDFIMYLISLLGIPALYVYVVIIPFFYLVSTTILSLKFAIRYNKSIHFVAPFVFFTFLATPLSNFLSLYKRGNFFFGFNYPTTMQSATALTNLAYAFTVPLILLTLIILQKNKITLKENIILSLLTAVAFGVKFYGGAVLICMIIFHFLLLFFKDRNVIKFLMRASLVGLFAAISIIYFYDPFSSSKTGSIFGYAPLATIHPLIEDPDALYIPYFVMARYALQEAGGFSPRLVAIELCTIAFYILYNAGTRVVGFIALGKQIMQRKLTTLEITLLTTIIFSAGMSMLFVQKGGDWWNTVQFFGYTLLLFNFFSALFFLQISNTKKIIRYPIYAIIILFTLPLNVELVMRSFQDKPYKVNNIEAKALEALKKESQGTVFTVPVMYETAYVPAYAEKPVYYADENILSNIGIDYEERKKQIADLSKLDIATLPIDYYYLKKNDKDFEIVTEKIINSNLFIISYENEEVLIYKKK